VVLGLGLLWRDLNEESWRNMFRSLTPSKWAPGYGERFHQTLQPPPRPEQGRTYFSGTANAKAHR